MRRWVIALLAAVLASSSFAQTEPPITCGTVTAMRGVTDSGECRNMRMDPATNGIIFSSTASAINASSAGAFGEQLTVSPSPLAQLKWVHGFNGRVANKILSGSGTVTASNSEVVVGSGTTIGSIGCMASKVTGVYEPGQGLDARFTFRFTAGVANTTQLAGVGTTGNGLFFGMDGTSFGVLRRTGGQPEVQTLTLTAGATGTGTITVTLNGGAVETEVTAADTIGEVATLIAASDYTGAGGGWVATDAGNRVIFRAVEADIRGGTYSFIDTDTTSVAATIAQSAAGAVPTDTWTASSAFSDDNVDATGVMPVIDPTTGQVAKIQYQWLGYGMILFALENPATGAFTIVHRIEFANANTSPSLLNPDLSLSLVANNGSTTSDVIVRSSSMGLFRQGPRRAAGPKWVAAASQSTVGTEEVILSIRNKDIVSSGDSHAHAIVESMAVGNNSTNRVATFRLVLNPSFIGAPTWTDLDTDSIVEVSSNASITYTGGDPVGIASVGAADGRNLVLQGDREIILMPGDVLALTGSLSSGTADLDGAIAWVELY